MLNSNCTYKIRKVTGRDVYGKETLAPAVTERGAIVKSKQDTEHSSVRADSTATRGFADEFTTNMLVLLDGKTVARQGDQLLVGGLTLRITSMEPQYDVLGKIDHVATRGEPWV